MDSARILKMLSMALRSDANENECLSAFHKVRESLLKEGLKFEDVVPDIESISNLQSRADELKRIIGLSRADYAQLVISLQTQVADLEQSAKVKSKEISKLKKALAKTKPKSKPAPKAVSKASEAEKKLKAINPDAGLMEVAEKPVTPSRCLLMTNPDSEPKNKKYRRAVTEGSVPTTYM